MYYILRNIPLLFLYFAFWNKPTAGQQPVAYNLRHSPNFFSVFCFVLFCFVGDELMVTSFWFFFLHRSQFSPASLSSTAFLLLLHRAQTPSLKNSWERDGHTVSRASLYFKYRRRRRYIFVFWNGITAFENGGRRRNESEVNSLYTTSQNFKNQIWRRVRKIWRSLPPPPLPPSEIKIDYYSNLK